MPDGFSPFVLVCDVDFVLQIPYRRVSLLQRFMAQHSGTVVLSQPGGSQHTVSQPYWIRNSMQPLRMWQKRKKG